jgi:hypothetical protein
LSWLRKKQAKLPRKPLAKRITTKPASLAYMAFSKAGFIIRMIRSSIWGYEKVFVGHLCVNLATE